MAADQSFHILVLFGITPAEAGPREGRARLRKTLFIALGVVVSAIGVFLYAIDGPRRGPRHSGCPLLDPR